jgi:hypothetical protein
MNNQQKSTSLVLCIVMDLLGYATYSIPVLGEFADLIWAPISAIVFFMMFGGWKGAFGSVFNFIEEILPGTDFIPSFTLMWLWQNFSKSKTREIIPTK